ncbi:hypothetical protein [Escherichia coli]|nr:hypothetical protein [Escherichia coli]
MSRLPINCSSDTHLPGETIMITSLIDFFISYIRRAPVAEYQSQPATVEH